ncbi:hypothetical protein [Nonomuraea indica]|nr:hypothetical protein [Nonomuraea indica]
MTELECPRLYEDGEYCGICPFCLALQVRDLAQRAAAIDGSLADLDTP